MAITHDGWLDWAERYPGPADKVYTEPNAALGYVPHSAVGYYGGWLNRLLSTQRDPNNPARYSDYAAASVHGFIFYKGRVVQHYPFTASCWASGNRHANTNFVAFENEGGYEPYNEPLTPEQVAVNIRIIRELIAWRGWEPRRPRDGLDASATLLEHNECVALWGGGATACPSSRIPWPVILAAFEEDDMAALWLVREQGQQYTFITDGFQRVYVEDPVKLGQLQVAGVWPTDVIVVPRGALSVIPRVS